MKPSLLVVHGQEGVEVRRLRALAGLAGDEIGDGQRAAMVSVNALNLEEFEKVAIDVPAHEALHVVHLVPESPAGQPPPDVLALAGAVEDVRGQLNQRFPAAQLAQWCVLQIGRELDRPEVELLTSLLDRRQDLALRGILTVPRSTTRTVAGTAEDASVFTADLVYCLLNGGLTDHDDLPRVTAAATRSVIYRRESVARATAARLAAEHLREQVLAEPDPKQNYRAHGHRVITDLDIPGQKDVLLGAQPNQLVTIAAGMKDLDFRERPGAVLAQAEETALLAIPDIMGRCGAAIPGITQKFRHSISDSLLDRLQRSGMTRPTWEQAVGIREQLERERKRLADLASKAPNPTLDAAVLDAERTGRDVPDIGATVVKGSALASLAPLAAAVGVVTWPVGAFLALLALGVVLGIRQYKVERAQRRLDDLTKLSSIRATGLVDRGVYLLLHDLVDDLITWFGDTGAPLADRPARDDAGHEADRIRCLHSQTVAALAELERVADPVAAGEGPAALTTHRFSIVLPEQGLILERHSSEDAQRAIADTRDRLRGIFTKWDFEWRTPRLVRSACGPARVRSPPPCPASPGRSSLERTPAGRSLGCWPPTTPPCCPATAGRPAARTGGAGSYARTCCGARPGCRRTATRICAGWRTPTMWPSSTCWPSRTRTGSSTTRNREVTRMPSASGGGAVDVHEVRLPLLARMWDALPDWAPRLMVAPLIATIILTLLTVGWLAVPWVDSLQISLQHLLLGAFVIWLVLTFLIGFVLRDARRGWPLRVALMSTGHVFRWVDLLAAGIAIYLSFRTGEQLIWLVTGLLLLSYAALALAPERDVELDQVPEVLRRRRRRTVDPGARPEESLSTELSEHTVSWDLSQLDLPFAGSASVFVNADRLAALRATNPAAPYNVRGVPYHKAAVNEWIVRGTTEEIDRLTRAVLDWSAQHNLTRRQQVYAVLSLVQKIPYTYDLDSTGIEEYWRYPVETIADNTGDCEDSTILAAAILRRMGFDVAMMFTPGHAALGVAGVSGESGHYVDFKGRRYLYCETTSEGWAIGQLPPGVSQGDVNMIGVARAESLADVVGD